MNKHQTERLIAITKHVSISRKLIVKGMMTNNWFEQMTLKEITIKGYSIQKAWYEHQGKKDRRKGDRRK